jgi:anti-sigma factor RsiW
MDTKFGNEPCSDGELLMSFMYGELTVDEHVRVDRHLATCQVCTDELAALGAVRSDVAFWKRTEFDSLPTPIVSLPSASDDNPRATVSTEQAPWKFANWIAGIFTTPRTWALGVSAFAAVVVTIGAAFLLAGSGNQDGARADGKQNRPVVTPSVTGGTTVSVTPEPTSPTSARGGTVSPTPEGRSVVNPTGSPSTVAIPAKSTRNGTRRNDAGTTPRTSTSPRTPRKEVPVVETADEDETDDSLRLAELFDEIGAR